MTIHEMRICYPAYRQQEETLARMERWREIDEEVKRVIDEVREGEETNSRAKAKKFLELA